ncbi:isopenicillin N synthase family dioxygenase [Primorskyibacter sp. S87]|uniref:isopenicillin N synthase family dioxygenase n=1 Tax=Primorskyibacter sp. S87 TaxID=3415126 RepID=UPI003C7DDF63
MQEIPTVDISPLRHPSDPLRPFVIAEIMDAFSEVGFLSITGTEVFPDLVDEVRQTVRDIFSVSEKAKWDQAITRNNYRGYVPLGFFAPNDGTGTADRYEGYKLHHEISPDAAVFDECFLHGPNIWPRDVPHAKLVLLTYWKQMDKIADLLLGALEEGLGLADGLFRDAFVNPLTNMTLLHYPPQAPDEAGFGIHPHKDTDALTIIAPDPVGGLEIQTRDGNWITPDCPTDGFVVNIGDMLELWTGGQLVSTPHRVVNLSGRERYSFPYFAVPRYDVVIEPVVKPKPGFDRPAVRSDHWSVEIWRTNWPDESANADTPELGTLHP